MKCGVAVLCGVVVLCSTPTIRQASAFLAPGIAVKQHRHDASSSSPRRCAHVSAAAKRCVGSLEATAYGDGSCAQDCGIELPCSPTRESCFVGLLCGLNESIRDKDHAASLTVMVKTCSDSLLSYAIRKTVQY